MFTQKQIVSRFSVFLLILWLISGFGLRALAKENDPNEQISLSKTPHKGNTDGNLPAGPEYKKDSRGWMGRLFGPILKYTPQEMEVPYTVLPESLEAWKNFKKNLEEKYGTSIGITLDDHHQQILNGPGAREGRNIFWWNVTLKQKLWAWGPPKSPVCRCLRPGSTGPVRRWESLRPGLPPAGSVGRPRPPKEWGHCGWAGVWVVAAHIVHVRPSIQVRFPNAKSGGPVSLLCLKRLPDASFYRP